EIEPLEAKWLKQSSLGGLRFAKVSDEIHKKCYSYDINRFYPYLQIKQVNIPLNKPAFEILDELPKDFLKTGVYRVKVEENEQNILFSYNKYNLYTHTSINQALKLGLSVELIQDGKFNAMIYKGKFVSSQRLNEVYKKLYNISKNCKTAKLIMNSIWGKVCQRNKTIKEYSYDGDEVIHLNYTDNIIRRPGGYEVETFGDDYYKYPFARLGTFLLSKGRSYLSNILQEHQKYILYIHTDGWLSKKELNIKLDKNRNMGSIRLDNIYHNVQIINKNTYKRFKKT
ncbi:MAG: hypothetical protein H6630_08885, partial [Arcobacter sp.]|nr:hypothetical protein [Arcobacter sp.]